MQYSQPAYAPAYVQPTYVQTTNTPAQVQPSYVQATNAPAYVQPSYVQTTGAPAYVQSSYMQSTPPYTASPEATASIYQSSGVRKSSTVRSKSGVVQSSILPMANRPAVTTGSTGTIIPAERPYAITTVTYAKRRPGQSSPDVSKKEQFRDYYAYSGTNGQPPQSPYTFQTRDEAAARAGRNGRFVRKEKGACGGCNEVFSTCFDSNGGCCGCLNCGCCDRGQKVPVDVAYSPDAF